VKTLSLSEAKMKLSGLVDSVEGTDAEVMITRNGRPAAVLISPDQFDSWKETVALRSDPELMAEVTKGLKALKSRKGRLYTLEALFD
jgi:antitoxin YefM